MVSVAFAWLFFVLLVTLAIRGALEIWKARPGKENDASTPTATTSMPSTADRLAALLEGEDDPESTIEDKLEALALGIKNLRHRQSMLDGRLNRIAPPAEKGKGDGGAVVAESRPLNRADIYKRWRENNARK